MIPHKTVVAEQTLVKLRLIEEKRVVDLLTYISHIFPNADAIYTLSKEIPCILRLEMRVRIKLLTILVLKEFSNAVAGKIVLVDVHL